MQSTPNTAISNAQMYLLLVGDNEDFGYLRDLLNRPGDGHLGLDQASSPEEALVRLGQTSYDMLLCEYKAGDSNALRFLHQVRKDGLGPPVIFLSDHIDDATVEAALQAGNGDYGQAPNVDEPSIRSTYRGQKMRGSCPNLLSRWSATVEAARRYCWPRVKPPSVDPHVSF
jgi:CheY-like chemotaxis protein